MEAHDADRLLAEYGKTRSEVAFRALVEGYGPMVIGIARQRLGSLSSSSEDVAQSVFIALAKRAKTIPDGNHLAAWLHRVTCRAAVDHMRKESRRLRRERIAAMEDTPDHRPRPELLERLDSALDSLKAEDRRLIILRFLEGRKIRAVGEAAGLSEDACRMRIRRALERLRGKLASAGVPCTTAALSRALASTPVAVPLPPAVLGKWCAAAKATSAAPASILNLTIMTTKTKTIASAVAISLIAIPVAIIQSADRRKSGTETSSYPGAAQGNERFRPGDMGDDSLPGSRKRPAASGRAAGEVSVNDLLDKASGICRHNESENQDDLSALVDELMIALGDLPPGQIPDALAKVDGISDARTRAMVSSALLGLWARTDGAAALDYASGKLADTDWVLPLSTPLREWAKADAAAAVEWINQADEKLLGRYYPGNVGAQYYLVDAAVSSIVSTGRLEQLGLLAGNAGTLNQMGYALADQIAKAPDPEALYERLGALPREQRIMVSGEISRVLAGMAANQGEGLKRWIDSMEDPEERYVASSKFAHEALTKASWRDAKERREDGTLEALPEGSWADSTEILNWAAANTPPEKRAEALNGLISSLVRHSSSNSGEMARAGEWLARQTGPDADAAKRTFAAKLAAWDREAAAEWAGTIQDAELRQKTMEEVSPGPGKRILPR